MDTHHHAGFTLLEIIVSIGIMGIISVVIVQVFTTVLRFNTKLEITNGAKQNGDLALEIMTRMIQGAQSISSPCAASPGTTSPDVTFVGTDGGTTTFGCGLTGSAMRIASNSASYLTGSDVTIANTSGICTLQFICTSTPRGQSSIQIAFRLAQVGTTGSLYEIASIAFQTSVNVRNK